MRVLRRAVPLETKRRRSCAGCACKSFGLIKTGPIKSKPKGNEMTRDARVRQVDRQDDRLRRMLALARELAAERIAADATYEMRQRAMSSVSADMMWLDEQEMLEELVAKDDRIEMDGVAYKKLAQPSSATYHGLRGSHLIAEPLYRQEGLRNGPTIKPLEARAGMIAKHVLPDAARVFGLLSAYMTSTEIEMSLKEMGFDPPGRAFIEKRLKIMAGEITEGAVELEEAARASEVDIPAAAAISCGLDRMAVQMDEPLPQGKTLPDRVPRKKPYARTPPPPAEHNWRMAWVGSMTEYDSDGNAIRTLRYGSDAGADRTGLANRIIADANATLARSPGAPVICIQDGAKDLRALPEGLGAKLSDGDLAALPGQLGTALPAAPEIYHLTDFHHLMSYLDEVVRTCEPVGDPHNMKSWYRGELLRDDGAIDRILRNLRRRAKTVPAANKGARTALARAISYIRHRKKTMRYASLHERNLPVGSGATESTCALMQLRVKRPGMAWKPPGLRGIMTIRGLVLSERWGPAWDAYAAGKIQHVNLACAA
jgi:hypothetical protein